MTNLYPSKIRGRELGSKEKSWVLQLFREEKEEKEMPWPTIVDALLRKHKGASDVRESRSSTATLLKKHMTALIINANSPSEGNNEIEISASLTLPTTVTHVVIEVIAEEVDQQISIPPTVVHEVGGSSQLADKPPAVYSPRAYIPAKDMLVTVEYSTLENKGVAFGLATNITPLKDMAVLEALKTLDLRMDTFHTWLL